MEPIWIPAIRRLMAGKGWKQKDLSEASGIRPNTICDLLAGTNSGIQTFAAVAVAFNVPMWTLFCTEQEAVLFTDSLKQQQDSASRDERARAIVEEQLAPLRDAMLARLAAPTPPVAAPVPAAVPAKRATRKRAG